MSSYFSVIFLIIDRVRVGVGKGGGLVANLKQCQLRGLRVGGPFIQIHLSGDALEHVFWGSEEVVWLFLYFLKVVPHRVVLVVSGSHIVGCILCDSEK